MAKVSRVNMEELSVKKEGVPEEYTRLGGRGLTSAIINQEVPADCHPLSHHNKIVYAPGLLTGTPAACSGRLSVGVKSPLTGGIKESNAGGTTARKLARVEINAVIVEGKPQADKWYTLKITHDGAKLESAEDIKGLGNYDWSLA